ncbi:MAG: tyrosine-protein phosphatase [Erysipelotrichales bacterium]|nr:tyrosine-protein phosphatase [Erysipelotrichales bacterium]
MKRITKCTAVLLALLMTLAFTSCKDRKDPDPAPDVPSMTDYEVEHELEFGGVYIKITIDDFNKLGFTYGDSVDVEFSNGYKLEDIPYYNGYYVDAGEPLLIAYPGYPYIKAAVNYGEDLWDEAELKASRENNLWVRANLEEHSKAAVKLREKGKYADIQAARDIQYSDERSKYTTDEEFANFRNMTVGNLKEGVVYRSASPCDNQHNRAPYTDRLIKAAGVNFILNLADNEKKIEGYIAKEGFDSPYFLELYQNGKVNPIAMSMNYTAEDFKTKLANGFISIAEHEGPYLIHCTEGKDRTGFVCMLLEALAGASYEEIVNDYMVTYDNYYKITKEKDPAKYDVILDKNLNAMLKEVIGDKSADLTKADLAAAAKAYLLKAGMTEEQISALLERVAG